MSIYEMMGRYDDVQNAAINHELGEREANITQSPVTMEQIAPLREMVTDILRARARTRVRTDSSEGFAMLQRGQSGEFEPSEYAEDYENPYDGSVDKYLATRLAQVDTDQWRMTVSIKTMVNTLEQNREFVRERFVFDWLEQPDELARVQAWKVTEFHHDVLGERAHEIVEMYPLTAENCRDLQTEMFAIADHAAPIDYDAMFANDTEI